ncbi:MULTISPECIES: hypothetical protein [unclassified Streptomyces]|uniref:hypothetical protein n=1 Tax=unclassified Streptomyces TaxID=2593676 RepID=UPI0033348850
MEQRKTVIPSLYCAGLLLRICVSLLGFDARDGATEIRHAQMDGGVPGGEVAQGGELLLGGGEAGLDRGDLAERPCSLASDGDF